MTSRVMMGLGGFRFGIDTAAYDSLTRDTDFGQHAVPRASNLPAYQRTTLGSETIELKGVVYPQMGASFQNGAVIKQGVGRGQLERLRAMGKQGVKLPLVSGYGLWLGMWVLMTLKEEDTRFFSDGIERKQGFTLSIEYQGAT
jgi:phage protein U